MAVKAVKKEPAKAEPQVISAEPPKKGMNKLVLIAVVAVLLGAAGYGGYWFSHREQGPHEAKAPPLTPPVFQPLDTFTVNLQLEESPQFLQTGITLKVINTEAADAIKTRMPEVRNTVLLLLSGRKASQLLAVEGKRKLGADIVYAINSIFNPGARRPAAKPVKEAPAAEGAEDSAAEPAPVAAPARESLVLDVLFTSFIIQ